MVNLNEVLEFINSSNQEELNTIRNSVTLRRSELDYDIKSSFRVGDVVGINHKKIPQSDTFKILKINNKKIKVQSDHNGGIYNVSPSLLVVIN